MTFNWIGKSSDGSTITLHKLKNEMFQFPEYFTPEWVASNPGIIGTGAVIDVETTGLDYQTDKIIDIGLQVFQFNRLTGEIVSLGTAYTGLQDPEEPLTEEIMILTDISNEMLKGQAIDWSIVDRLVSSSEIIIAHDASFDRP